MKDRTHHYAVDVVWTGARDTGTLHYRSYDRDHEIRVAGKPPLHGSSDPAFRGSRHRYNPEEMLVASLSACHMLWYLHLCADNDVVVTGYRDQATGLMGETPNGSGRFIEAVLRPEVVINPSSSVDMALQLHRRAHELCFIANSVNFPVLCTPAVSDQVHGGAR